MSLLRKALGAPSRLVPRAYALAAQRSMTLGGLKGYDEKESVEENLFMKKEDEKAVRKLLAKLKAQAEAAEPAAAAESKQEEVAALKPLIDKYKMSAHDVEALIAWRNNPDL